MIYDPDPWQHGYVYLMRKDERKTMKVLLKLKNVMIGKMIFNVPDYRDGNIYCGWMRFARPLPLWEAMEAGLVPIFDMYRNDDI